MMWVTIRDNFRRFHQSFHYSSVIWFARIQVVVGAIWTALTAVDLAPIIQNPKYVALWLVFSGAVTELGRRSNTFINPEGQLAPVPRGPSAAVMTSPATPAPASPVPTASDAVTK